MRLSHVLKAAVFLSLGMMMGTGVFLANRDAEKLAAQKHLHHEIQKIQENSEPSGWQKELADINPDYCAWLEFDSGLLALPVVQGTDNSYWLDHLFDGSYGISGTLFFDAQCEQNDPIRVIYGHSVFFDPSMMFTPLHRLKDQTFFEENRTFRLIGPETEKHFKIFAVCVMDENLHEAAMVRTRRFVSSQDQKQWLLQVLAHSAVNASYEPTGEENTVVFVTCEEADSSKRLYVFSYEMPS